MKTVHAEVCKTPNKVYIIELEKALAKEKQQTTKLPSLQRVK